VDPESLLPAHAQHLVTAYDNGERDRKAMAANLLQPERLAMSPSLQSVQEDLERFR